MIEAEEQALVQKLVAHAAAEGFDITVLNRLAGPDLVPFHPVILRPDEGGVRGELGAVAGNGHAGPAAAPDQAGQFPRDPASGLR